jgi:hypothetical protein
VSQAALQTMRIKPGSGSSRAAASLSGQNPKLENAKLFLFKGGLGVIDDHGVWLFSEDEINNWSQGKNAASR